MADVYLALSGNEFVAPEDGYPKALAATRVALELDPALPAARTALGFVTGFFTGDVPAAMNEFNIACAIDPHWANAEYFAGMLALNVGDFDTATARLRRALELAPRHSLLRLRRTWDGRCCAWAVMTRRSSGRGEDSNSIRTSG